MGRRKKSEIEELAQLSLPIEVADAVADAVAEAETEVDASESDGDVEIVPEGEAYTELPIEPIQIKAYNPFSALNGDRNHAVFKVFKKAIEAAQMGKHDIVDDVLQDLASYVLGTDWLYSDEEILQIAKSISHQAVRSATKMIVVRNNIGLIWESNHQIQIGEHAFEKRGNEL